MVVLTINTKITPVIKVQDNKNRSSYKVVREGDALLPCQ